MGFPQEWLLPWVEVLKTIRFALLNTGQLVINHRIKISLTTTTSSNSRQCRNPNLLCLIPTRDRQMLPELKRQKQRQRRLQELRQELKLRLSSKLKLWLEQKPKPRLQLRLKQQRRKQPPRLKLEPMLSELKMNALTRKR